MRKITDEMIEDCLRCEFAGVLQDLDKDNESIAQVYGSGWVEKVENARIVNKEMKIAKSEGIIGTAWFGLWFVFYVVYLLGKEGNNTAIKILDYFRVVLRDLNSITGVVLAIAIIIIDIVIIAKEIKKIAFLRRVAKVSKEYTCKLEKSLK